MCVLNVQSLCAAGNGPGSQKCNARLKQIWLSGKDPPANAGDVREVGLIPRSGRSPGVGHGSIHAWKIPPLKEPGGLQSIK